MCNYNKKEKYGNKTDAKIEMIDKTVTETKIHFVHNNIKNTRNYCIQQERILTDTENIQWFPVGRGKEGRAI